MDEKSKTELSTFMLSTLPTQSICFELVVRINKILDKEVNNMDKLTEQEKADILHGIGQALSIIWTVLGAPKNATDDIAINWRQS